MHALATAMPHVTCVQGPSGNPVYQVGGKSFVFFRTPRPDATDPHPPFGEVGYDELAEIVADAWLSRASARRATQWLESRGLH